MQKLQRERELAKDADLQIEFDISHVEVANIKSKTSTTKKQSQH